MCLLHPLGIPYPYLQLCDLKLRLLQPGTGLQWTQLGWPVPLSSQKSPAGKSNRHGGFMGGSSWENLKIIQHRRWWTEEYLLSSRQFEQFLLYVVDSGVNWKPQQWVSSVYWAITTPSGEDWNKHQDNFWTSTQSPNQPYISLVV